MKPLLKIHADRMNQGKAKTPGNRPQRRAAIRASQPMGMSIFIALFMFAFSFTACNEGREKKAETRRPTVHHGHGGEPDSYEYITRDTANKMLSSYLVSINSTVNDTDLRSLIINADTLRAYLSDTSIKEIKIMMAHTLSYINSGGMNQPCGYDGRDLTFIIAGYNSIDNYVYYMTKSVPITPDVINHGAPCPNSCPPTGSAANDLLE